MCYEVMAMCLFITGGGVVPHIHNLEGGGVLKLVCLLWIRENSCFFLELHSSSLWYVP